MRCFNKWIICFFVLCLMAACGKKSEGVFLEKDGNLYEVADQVSFYYPKDFVLNSNNDNKETLQFIKDQEVLSYTTVLDDTDNKVEDMPKLYAGQLEEDGAKDVGFHAIKLDSGLKCYVFTGSYISTGLRFKYVIYFTSDATYEYGYQAPQDVYQDNIDVISRYLESLTVHHELSS